MDLYKKKIRKKIKETTKDKKNKLNKKKYEHIKKNFGRNKNNEGG